MLRALDRTVDKYGQPKTNELQAALRLVGVNLYPIDPQRSRAENLERMQFEIQSIERRMTALLRDRNLSSQERKKIQQAYGERIQRRQKQLQQYAKESRVHPNLR
jgi:hypothetical protein